MKRIALLLLAAACSLVPSQVHANEDVSVSLRGSRASMLRQNRIAKDESYSFLRTPAQVRNFIDDGRLLPLDGNDDYAVIAGYPYARPIIRSFIERLAGDYRAACGEKLVVTSLTRPAARQPRNASPLSVHPAGMAVDLRVSSRSACSGWLKDDLLRLEERGVLDATLERSPPHFHVAVFPTPYAAYDSTLVADSAARAERMAEEERLRRQAALEARVVPAVVAVEPPGIGLLARIVATVTLLLLRIVA